MSKKKGRKAWFAVRCVFAVGWTSTPQTRPLYEERITLWHAGSFEEAIGKADKEAEAYASAIEEKPSTFLGLAQAYRLFDEPRDGAEVFSLLRESDLEPEDYLHTFFTTGSERTGELVARGVRGEVQCALAHLSRDVSRAGAHSRQKSAPDRGSEPGPRRGGGPGGRPRGVGRS